MEHAAVGPKKRYAGEEGSGAPRPRTNRSLPVFSFPHTVLGVRVLFHLDESFDVSAALLRPGDLLVANYGLHAATPPPSVGEARRAFPRIARRLRVLSERRSVHVAWWETTPIARIDDAPRRRDAGVGGVRGAAAPQLAPSARSASGGY
eukprot:gene52179-8299_t